MRTIGVCGQGFVGTAVREGMKHAMDVLTYDKFKPELSTELSIADMVRKTDTIFVCVPTPMRDDGSSDTSIVESVVREIDSAVAAQGLHCPVVVIKSTVPPGTSQALDAKYDNVYVAFNPEFLTEANAIEDFKNQDRIVVGHDRRAVLEHLEELYHEAYPNVPVFKVSSSAAEMVKYTTNCFLATKLSFANELFQICKALGVTYAEVVEVAKQDKRLGTSHWMVPGPDGKFGWGLSCFPKDLNALKFLAEEAGVATTMLNAAWEKNLEVRPPEDRDWEHMEKAVVNPKKTRV